MSKIQKLKFPNFTWTNIENPLEKDVQQLAHTHKFHPLDISDCLASGKRSKIDIYEDYTFLSFLLPVYDYNTRQIDSAKIDFFISKNYFISLHRGNLGVFNEYFNVFQLSRDLRQKFDDNSPEKLLYEIMNKLYGYCMPMIDHMIEDCDKIEQAIFSGKEKSMISEILIIRRNITDYRKIMQVHKNIIKKLIVNLKENELFVMKKSDVYFESLLDYTKEIWDTLENLKERIEALQQTNESQISFKLSDIMRTLTVISVITFPVTLLATIFGMNTVHSMPFIESTYGFWYIISLMLSIVIGMLLYFKKKGWM